MSTPCPTHLLVPLQQHGTAVVGRALKALVDVLHQQVDAVLVQRLHRLLNVIGFERDEDLQDDAFRAILSINKEGRETFALLSDAFKYFSSFLDDKTRFFFQKKHSKICAQGSLCTILVIVTYNRHFLPMINSIKEFNSFVLGWVFCLSAAV